MANQAGWEVLTQGDILINTLNYLNLKDFVKCARVNKFWYRTVNDPKAWEGERGNILLANN